jgi:hypothetical protein
MTEQVLNDFFIFISNGKEHICNKDIEDFEIFLQRKEFEDIQDDMIEFINDMLYWVIKKLDLDNDLNVDGVASNVGIINNLGILKSTEEEIHKRFKLI